MTTRKINPLIEIFEIAVMIILDRYYLRRWLPPVISAITAGVVVGLISSTLYLVAWKTPPKRLFLFLLLAVVLSILLRI